MEKGNHNEKGNTIIAILNNKRKNLWREIINSFGLVKYCYC